MPKTKYIIDLPNVERERLEEIIREKKEPEKAVIRAKILLALCSEKNRKKTVLSLAEELGTTHTTIQTVKTAYCQGGLDAAVFRKKRTVTFVNKRINENVIKQILRLAGQKPPNGHKRWSVRLLCQECMDQGIVSHIAPSTMQGILRNAGLDLNGSGVMSGGRRAPQLSNPEEISLWNKLIQMQGTVFCTSGRGNRPGVQFTYTIRGAELFASTKEKSITRASIISAYWKAKELDGFVSGPKKLGVFGSSYLYPVFIAIGVIKQIPINERDSEATMESFEKSERECSCKLF